MEEILRAVLEGEPRVAYALLFGSHARGTARPDSDIDIAVAFDGEIDHRAIGTLIAELEAATSRRVDLTFLDRAPPPLAFRVFSEGRLLLCRDRAAMVRRKARAIVDYLDFRPIEQRCVEGVLARARGR